MKKVLIPMRKLTNKAIKKTLQEKISSDPKVTRKKGQIIVPEALRTMEIQPPKIVLIDLEFTVFIPETLIN